VLAADFRQDMMSGAVSRATYGKHVRRVPERGTILQILERICGNYIARCVQELIREELQNKSTLQK